MKATLYGSMGAAMFALVAFAASPAFGAAADVPLSVAKGEQVTYAKHISRLMQQSCQECHNPGGIGPFSLLNYRQTKAWSKMIREVVDTNRMPPWGAAPHVGKFSNDRSLSQEEKDMLFAWIDNGMPRGNAEDMPEEIEFHNRWRIGEPDMVFELPEEVTIEPTGVVDYKYFMTKTNFTEDKWVKAAECLPGNPKVVHHIIMFVREPGDNSQMARGEDGNGFFDAFAPGGEPMVLEPGQARKIPAGAELIWQMHYTPTGKTETDRSQFGIIFADEAPEQEVMTENAINFNFQIPAGAPNHRVESEYVFEKPATIISFAPHMHYRGKSFTYELVKPDGTREMLLDVPQYDFNWQITYDLAEPLHVEPGAKLHCVAHFDNSADNPYNPNPDRPVSWGDQTWEEMMIGFFHFAYDKKTDAVSGD